MGHIIEIAFGIRVIEIYGRRDHIVIDTEDGNDGFNTASGTEQMACHGFCRTYGNLICMFTKYRLYCVCFNLVSVFCRSAMGIYIVHSPKDYFRHLSMPFACIGPRPRLPEKERLYDMHPQTCHILLSLHISRASFHALSSLSSIMMPAPSPITKPSLRRSKGLLAFSGSSFLVDNAFIALNPPIPKGVMTASVPPAIMTSASPRWIILRHPRSHDSL